MPNANTEPREDFLEEDAEIPGQKFCLLSFLSPEKVLADKNVFLFSKFVQTYDFHMRTKSLEAFLMQTVSEINKKFEERENAFRAADLSGAADLCRASQIRMDTLMDEVQKFVKANDKELRESKLKETYDDFLYVNRVKLEDEFYQKNEFRTTVRGLKVRGVYGSQAEAVARSKKLQRSDPLHNIFVGEIGKWLPWDPEPSDVAEQEYAEEQLNALMKKYKENEEQREEFQREQRSRLGKKSGSGAQAAGPIFSTSRVEDGGAPTAATPEAPVPTVPAAAMEGLVERMGSMFGSDGPADLAIQRKMEKAAAASAASE
jgi:hypothetical protein